MMLKRSPAILNIVGSSGSGKTTLIERVLPRLREHHHLKVSVIKHSHHQIEFEPKHKDSARFRAGGAHEVMVVSPYRWALFRELTDEMEPDVDACVARMAGVDLVLVEGFKQSPYPKLEVFRPALGREPLHPSNPTIGVVASPAEAEFISQCQRLDLDDPAQISSWIVEEILGRTTKFLAASAGRVQEEVRYTSKGI